MTVRRVTSVLIAAGVLALASQASADCKIKVLADFPLQPNPNRLLVSGAVNGKPAVFILDTGAAISAMPYKDALKTGVSLSGMNNMTSEGIGGRAKTGTGHFDLRLGSINLPDEVMTVVAMRSLDSGATALIGRELLMQHDLELDLPDNDVKVVEPQGCSADQLAYWNKPYSEAKLEGDRSSRPAILTEVLLNGRLTPALIDSGAERSVVTVAAARAAGADLASATSTGKVGGIGVGTLSADVVRFDSFTIGDETIKNAKLIVSDLWRYNKHEETGTRLGSETHDMAEPRMVLGADFLRAHRLLVANSMGVLVFSYVGGPVFDISQTARAAPAGSAAAGAGAAAPSAAPDGSR